MIQTEFTFVAPRDHRVSPTEARRLSGQCLAILTRLRQGRATNYELAELSLKYTARTSDLRKAGYAIEVVSRDHKTGVCVYELTHEPTSTESQS